jgi:hypothetical protein
LIWVKFRTEKKSARTHPTRSARFDISLKAHPLALCPL